MVNPEVRLGLHMLFNADYMIGMLSKGNCDDLNESESHETAESQHRHNQDNTKFIALLKTMRRN